MDARQSLEIIVPTPDALPEVVEQLLDFAGSRKKFILSGELGAGKTTLVQAVCRRLGVQQQATSPTFSIVNEYAYTDESNREQSVFHLDLYRLKNLTEALDIGIEEILAHENYCFIEWAEVIEPLLPEDVVRISISIEDNSARKIILS